MEFSIDSGKNIPFSRLDCFAYDIKRDPALQHKIRPLLIGADGISKKVAVPFLTQLRADEPFNVVLNCRLPGCMTSPVGYYISTLSFAQKRVPRCTVKLIFVGEHPDWVRVYERTGRGCVKLLKDLRPLRRDSESNEYVDARGAGGWSPRLCASFGSLLARHARLQAPPREIDGTSELQLETPFG